MAKSELIDFTGAGRPDERWHAADILIFSKQTRLEMSPGLLQEIKAWPEERKREELAYMAGTIPSSWEFASFKFLLTGVSRAAAQQITRTRTASYAMQTQRVSELVGVGVVNPYKEGTGKHSVFADSAEQILGLYQEAIQAGSTPQEARGLLPLNVECNLLVEYNLRTFVDLCRARQSLRAQGEYSDLVDQMKAQVLEVWPWAAPFFTHPLDAAIAMLEGVAEDVGLTPGKGHGWEIAKAIDLLRKA